MLDPDRPRHLRKIQQVGIEQVRKRDLPPLSQLRGRASFLTCSTPPLRILPTYVFPKWARRDLLDVDRRTTAASVGGGVDGGDV